MSDDPRLLIHSTDHVLERDLLASLRDLSPPDGAREQGWQTIARDLAVLGLASTVAQSTATHSVHSAHSVYSAQLAKTAGLSATPGATTLTAKLVSAKLLIGITVGSVGIGGSLLALRSASQAPGAQTTQATQTRVEEATPAASQTPAPLLASAPPLDSAPPSVAVSFATDPPAPIRTSAKPTSNDLLLRESTVLVATRAKLRSGDKSGASAALRQLDTEFPQGKLLQEREVLRIELLAALGNHKAATERARSFLKRYPHSAHTAHVQRLMKSP